MTENNSNDAVKTKALVAIRCITYNHEAYIRDALEGFIMQKTNFPFVAIVHDDASTDGTANIIREYAAKYPDIIKPIYETENQYSKHDGSLGRIMTAACEATGAKYIAMCEGDDYWTDPLKLQKQVDFLETHPDYSMCFGNAIEHRENGNSPNREVVSLPPGDVSPLELYAHWQAPTATILHRINVLNLDIYKRSISLRNMAFGDIQIGIASGFCGKIYFIPECMSVYRKHQSGASEIISNDPWPHIKTRHQLSKIYGKEYVNIDKQYVAIYFIRALKKPLAHYPNNLKLIFWLLWFSPIYSLKELKWIIRSLKAKISH